ncbi:Biotin carboxylase [bacterium HR40]|nr:Biotin carboxylase [bacterium HR40]
MIRKVLIANRGEIAVRILRACRELDIATVAVHSTADAGAMHVRLADESVCIGPPPAARSYLDKAAILAAAEITGADAIHPGYGFLAENPEFAEMVREHGYVFIGPDPEHIRVMGDKIRAKAKMRELGVPVVPGSDGAVRSREEAARIAAEIGYPVLIKAVAGGGGRGMVVVRDPGDLPRAFDLARSEARAGFGDDRVYIEKFLDRPRHIEIQVLGDRHGNVVHLFERDCSIQRRHQKVIEEAPSPVLDDAARAAIGSRVVEAMRQLGYVGAGTVEFLWADGQFYFIEMNTRIQVEHPVTEMITGVDLVREQIRIAAGEPLDFDQDDLEIRGHAMEFRITAEDPETMLPAPGRVTAWHPAGGPGVRVDSHLYAGYTIPPYYDSLIAKLVVHDRDRPRCLARARRSLGEFVVDGTPSTMSLLRAIVESEQMLTGTYDIGWLERFLEARRS